jgi:hypothetical protein
MASTLISVEELAPRTEDEVREHLAVMVRWNAHGPMNEAYVGKPQSGYRG